MELNRLVNKWFDKWKEGDYLNLPISEDFKHTSPFGIINGKKEYISLVEANKDKFLGYRFEIQDEIFNKEKACVRYTAIQGDFKLEVSEWYYVKNNLIESIVSYYHIGEIREERKLSERQGYELNQEKKRNWPIVAVADVNKSSDWYKVLLDAKQNHQGSTVFNQILDKDGTILLCLHHWGPSGPQGNHEWASLSDPGEGPVWNGILLWFVVDDFNAAWQRAQDLGAIVHETPNTNNGTGMRAFVVRDPDGYYVAVNEAPN